MAYIIYKTDRCQARLVGLCYLLPVASKKGLTFNTTGRHSGLNPCSDSELIGFCTAYSLWS